MSNDSGPAHVQCKNLHRAFTIGEKEIRVLQGVDLDVQRGEKMFLCGASGAGKTSLLYTLAGLERPNEGSVSINGQSLYELPASDQARIRNQQMGYVFQNYFLLPELTALENVQLPAMIGKTDLMDHGNEMLDRVGLADRMNHLPAELSGGEQQRVAIARALINKPEILFADEPTGNLDSKTGSEVMDLLLEMVESEKTTMIVVTHDQDLAKTGDRTVFLADGRLVA
ncbi:MAG: putative ABC-type transport system involved in lysophospholipase L1 biosynthesis ATPase subunit [Verrucomicrobiales bacterium]|jgi:predicted ABC-type transport system involved in lysophospholipase L1 biosynthesis ATPase subunit